MADIENTVSPHFRHLPLPRGLSTTPPAADTISLPTPDLSTECAPSFLRASMLMRKAVLSEKPALTSQSAKRPHKKETVKRTTALKVKAPVISEEYVLDSEDDERTASLVDQAGQVHEPQRSSYFQQASQAAHRQAAPRRRSWTPVRDTVADESDDDVPLAQRLGHNFTAMINSFAYPDAPKGPEIVEPTKKRRKTADKPPKEKKARQPKVPKPPAEPKVKKPKKKVQTITALATAPYRLPVTEPTNPQTTIPEVLAKVQDTVAAPISVKRKRKAPTSDKKPKKTARIKTPTKDLPPRTLLAPSQAQASLSNQVFIFGTSSQLYVEDSPETLQQIQIALQQSELSPGSTTVSPAGKSKVKVPTAPHGTSLSGGQAHRDLWCVSARDHGGGILIGEGAESQDSRIDSVCEGADTSSKPADATHAPSTAQDPITLLSSDPPEVPAQAAPPSQPITSRPSPSSLPPWPSAQRNALQPLDANTSLRASLQGKSPAAARFKSALSPASTTTTPRRGRARKEPETVTILSSSPAALFQQPKRTTPSKILEQLQSSPPGSWHNIDDILDEAAPPTPTPPRKQVSVAVQETLEFEKVPAEPVVPACTVDDQWPAVYAALFPKITSTIKGMPRSNSLTHPNWHEKILLYDPIVIEDLTSWLNGQGLRVKFLKSKGRKKKAVLEPDVEEMEEELTHQMVQKWCEDHSVCCLWKEGLRGGVRTRY